MSYSDDFDPPEFYTETRPKAKKEHCCCECKKTINVGDEYVRITGKWDGVCRTYKTCSHCENLRRLMYKKFDINCVYECLYMDMQDGEITEEELLAK